MAEGQSGKLQIPELTKVGDILYGNHTKRRWPRPMLCMDSSKQENLFAIGVSKHIEVR